ATATPAPQTPQNQPPTAAVKLPPIPNNEVKQRLVVRALEDSWVKYQSDDRPIQAYMLRKEKVIFVRARSSIRFMTGNPKGVEISYDNKQFRPFGSNTKLLFVPKEAE